MRAVAGLAAVAALLAVYLLVGDRHGPTDGETAAEPARLLPAFDRASVRRITIARAGAPSLSLERQPPGVAPGWRLEPGARPADDAAVEELLNALDLAEIERTADLRPAAAGLEPPLLAVEIASNGPAITLRLGKAVVGGRGVFARVGQDPAVRVVTRRLRDLADRPEDELGDRRLIPLPIEDVSSIGWRTGGSGAPRGLRLVGGRWQNERSQWVAGERVAELLRRMVDLHVESTLRPPALAFEGAPGLVLATAVARVELRFGGGSCGSRPGTFVSRDGSMGQDGACVATDAVQALWGTLERSGLPDTRLVSSPPEDVTRIEMTDAGRRLRLERGPGGSWAFAFPKVPYSADRGVVEDWLRAAGRAHVPASPAGAPARRLTVDARYQEVAEVSARQEAYVLVDPDPLRFRERAVLDFAHFDARMVRRLSAGTTVEIVSADGDSWRATTPPGAAVDEGAAARVVGGLANLRADRFWERPPPGPPELSFELVLAAPGGGAAIRHALEIFAAPSRGCSGRLDRTAALFSLPLAACEALRAPLTAD
jgi:uncharacterized protein DUF4340